MCPDTTYKLTGAISRFTASPIFDPVHGFGSNGAFVANWTGFFGNSTPSNSGGGCVADGPFKDVRLSVGPGTSVTDHCLVRNFNAGFARWGNSTQVANTTGQPDFESFRQETGGAFKPPPYKIHDAGHGMIGGEMGNVFSSPGGVLSHSLSVFSYLSTQWRLLFLRSWASTCFPWLTLKLTLVDIDPLFYLHHANLDRVWAMWQDMDLEVRLRDISGYSSFFAPFVNVTLDYQLNYSTLAPPIAIRDVMNTRGTTLCYEYV
jgi:tyrosinase